MEWTLTGDMLESTSMLRRLGKEARMPLQNYLQEALGRSVVFQPCPDVPVPMFLQNSYAFAFGRLLGSEYVFAAPLETEERKGPVWHAKQRKQLEDLFGLPVVLVLDTLTGRDRQRLVQERALFIVPFKQMYLPPAGVDFREWTLEARADNRAPTEGPFTPTTQLILLHALLRVGSRELDVGELARDLEVSDMSVSRAFKDLQQAELMIREKRGRRHPARLAAEERVVWEKAQPRLVNPVQARYSVPRTHLPGMLDAGLTALSRLSDLAAPAERVVAIGPDAWRAVRDEIEVEPLSSAFGEVGRMTVEVWSYAPVRLSRGGQVDPLSLYLSLKDDFDERVQLALQQALEEIPWIRHRSQ